MTKRSDTIIQAEISRLVDGDLSHEERSNLLLKLEHTEDGWRALALAFVENQIFNESSKQFLMGRPEPPSPPPTELKQDDSLTRSWSYRSLWIVAGLVLGLYLGAMLYSPAFQDISPPRNALAKAKQREYLNASPRDTIPKTKAELSLSEALSRSAIPIPIEFRRQMRSAGYVVNEEHRETRVSLPSGESVSVPIRNVEIQYLGVSAYQ